MIGFQGLLATIRDFLSIPIGSALRQAGDKNDKKTAIPELIASIVDITVDDVCIGATPFYYKSRTQLGPQSKLKVDTVIAELNSIAKWIAKDLLLTGVSTYSIKLVKQKLVFLPALGDYTYVLNEDKTVDVYEGDAVLKDMIVFINYQKDSLTVAEKGYTITPVPIQLKNVTESTHELSLVEKSIYRYRRDISRVVRFITADVGISQGDNQSNVIENISSGINANSLSLEGTAADMFEDEIPVFPTRKNVGEIKIQESVPSADITKVADLDHVLSKIFLGMRFPKSYADFSTALDASAVSLIRGDIRYGRMLKTTRSLMETTVQKHFGKIQTFRANDIVIKLTEVPNPEDEEVLTAIEGYMEFLTSATEYFLGAATKEEALYRLDSLASLLGDSANLQSLEKWIKATRDYIHKHFEPSAGGEGDGFEGTDPRPEEEFSGDQLSEEGPPEGVNPDEPNADDLNQDEPTPEFPPDTKKLFPE